MTITIRLKTGNAAFEDKGREVARIVREAVLPMLDNGEVYEMSSNLFDSDGNMVGFVKVTGK